MGSSGLSGLYSEMTNDTQTHKDAYYQKQKVTNAGKDAEKLEASCAVGGKVQWHSHYGKQRGGS